MPTSRPGEESPGAGSKAARSGKSPKGDTLSPTPPPGSSLPSQSTAGACNPRASVAATARRLAGLVRVGRRATSRRGRGREARVCRENHVPTVQALAPRASQVETCTLIGYSVKAPMSKANGMVGPPVGPGRRGRYPIPEKRAASNAWCWSAWERYATKWVKAAPFPWLVKTCTTPTSKGPCPGHRVLNATGSEVRKRCFRSPVADAGSMPATEKRIALPALAIVSSSPWAVSGRR